MPATAGAGRAAVLLLAAMPSATTMRQSLTFDYGWKYKLGDLESAHPPLQAANKLVWRFIILLQYVINITDNGQKVLTDAEFAQMKDGATCEHCNAGYKEAELKRLATREPSKRQLHLKLGKAERRALFDFLGAATH